MIYYILKYVLILNSILDSFTANPVPQNSCFRLYDWHFRLFGAAFFAGFAHGGDISRAEYFALGAEEHGGKDGSEDVADGAAAPHAREAVGAAVDEKHRHEVHHGDEEQHLPAEARDDGYPGLVDRLEEL